MNSRPHSSVEEQRHSKSMAPCSNQGGDTTSSRSPIGRGPALNAVQCQFDADREDLQNLDEIALQSMVKEMKALKIGIQPEKTRETLIDEVKNLHRELTKKNKEIQRMSTIIAGLREELISKKPKGIVNGFDKIKRLQKGLWELHFLTSGFPDPFREVQARRERVWKTYAQNDSMGSFTLCCHCSQRMDFKTMTVDHLKPWALGGGDEIENLRPSCYRCNRDRPLEDVSFKFKPVHI